MLSKIEIRGFTAQRKCDIEFSPNVTTLTGSSFTGKSTILRAIRFVCMNKPSGDKMISWGKDKTTNRLFVDGKKITRRKGKGVNTYKLGKEVFKAFGNDVPQPIAELVNMGPINFQGQHDKPFWFCETAGEVSRQLNKIVNLEVIDKTLSHIDSEIRDATADIKLTKKRLEDAEEQKGELAFAVALDTDLACIEKLEKALNEKAVESALLAEIVKKASEYRGDRKKALQLTTGGETAMDRGTEWRKIRDKRESLGILMESALQETKIINACPPDTLELQGLCEVLQNHEYAREELESLISEIEAGETKLWDQKEMLTGTTEKLTQATKGRCPLCGKTMIKS